VFDGFEGVSISARSRIVAAADVSPVLPCLTLPLTTLTTTLKAASFPFPAPVTHELFDLGRLHLPEAPRRGFEAEIGRCSLPTPRMYTRTARVLPRRRGLMLLMTVRRMVCGISREPGESDDLAHVANALQLRVRASILPGATARSSFAGRRVAVVGGQLLLSPGGPRSGLAKAEPGRCATA
jgi:hypothetical protein